MSVLVGVLTLTMAFANRSPVENLRQCRLRHRLNPMPTVAALRAQDDLELAQSALSQWPPATEGVYTTAHQLLAVRDSVMMELAYLEAGTVRETEIGISPFQTMLVQHELINQTAQLLRDRNFTLAAPNLWESAVGRGRFSDVAATLLRFAQTLRTVRAYWDDMDQRSQRRLDNGPMMTEIERLVALLKDHVDALVSSATPRERHSPKCKFQELRELSQTLDGETFLTDCQLRLAGAAAVERRRSIGSEQARRQLRLIVTRDLFTH